MKSNKGSIVLLVCLIIFIVKSASAQALQAVITLNQSGQTVWNYTLINLEPANSNNWLTDFYLPLNAPITDVNTSSGWLIDTDNTTYIQWSNSEAYPYPNDIAPSNLMSGFSFTSIATGSPVQYILSSWDHGTDSAGPYANSTILSPDSTSAVPEPSTITTFSIGALSLLLFAVCRRSKRTGRSI